MSRRAAFIYLAIAVLLGGAYFLATRLEEKKAEQKSRERRVFDLKTEDVVALKIGRAGEEEVEIAREGEPGAWRITAPRALGANQAAVGEVVEAMVETERLRDLEGSDLDPAEYGLEAPALRVSAEAGGTWRTIAFGEENIGRDARYARVEGAPEIFLVAAYAFNRMDRGLEGLRDRRLLPLPHASIRAITVARGDERFLLRKEDDAWRFADSSRPVSETAVDGLIGVLTESEVERFVTEEETDLAAYGLDAPDVTVTFQTKDENKDETAEGSAEATGDEAGGARRWVRLAASGEGDDAEVLAARSGLPGVVALDARFLDRLPENAAALEDQALFRGELADAREVVITGAGAEARFSREGETWRGASEGPDEKEDEDAGAPDVEGLLTLLQDLSHEGAPGGGAEASDKAAVTIRIDSETGEPLLDLKIAGEASGDAPVLAKLADDAGTRDVSISRFTIENLYDKLRQLSPALIPRPAAEAAGNG